MEEIIKENALEVTPAENKQVRDGGARDGGKKFFDKKKTGDKRPRREDNDGFDKVTVQVNRVTKVVKGGKTMRMSALVVVGDKKGKIGLGSGKAAEHPMAIEKATSKARKSLITVNLLEGTIPHEVIGKFGTSKVLLIPAPEGTGVIAGGSARSVLQLAGIKNITCKSFGSRNAVNNVKATIEALKLLHSREQIAKKRGKKPEEI